MRMLRKTVEAAVHDLSFVWHFLEETRKLVPLWLRWVVAAVGLGLAVATFGFLPLFALGMKVDSWQDFVHSVCGPFCHQYYVRSFQVGATVFPLCARCTGMWLGITLGAAVAMRYRAQHRYWTGGVLAVLALSASAWDWLRENAGGEPNAWARAGFGFLLFVGVMWVVSYDVLGLLVRGVRWVRGTC